MNRYVNLIAYLTANYPGQKWSSEAQQEYVAALMDCDPEECCRAARHFFANDEGGFRPTPGKLKALIRGDVAGDAHAAWQNVLQAVYRYAGRPAHETCDMPAEFDTRTRRAVQAIGGFRQWMSGIQSKEIEFIESRFVKAYKREAVPQLALGGNGRNPELDGRGPTLLGGMGL